MARFAPRKVSKAVGNNPIAQAVARKQVHDSIVSTQINLHMLEEGEDCGALFDAMAFLLGVMARAAWQSNAVGLDQQQIAMADAIAVLETCKNAWDKSHLSVLDAGLAAADQTYRALPGSVINEAIKKFRKVVDMP